MTYCLTLSGTTAFHCKFVVVFDLHSAMRVWVIGIHLLEHTLQSSVTLLIMQTLEYIEDNLPQETPQAFGLHPNAGIGFRLREAEQCTEQLNSLQQRSATGGSSTSVEEKARMVCMNSPGAVLKAKLQWGAG